mmetsp:Transcript_18029/g.29238  ORF Transcript_18029/g.29238 Transcript_18029/m.29238 type:complete len:129 (-) Transcript_18029:932-1318(-)
MSHLMHQSLRLWHRSSPLWVTLYTRDHDEEPEEKSMPNTEHDEEPEETSMPNTDAELRPTEDKRNQDSRLGLKMPSPRPYKLPQIVPVPLASCIGLIQIRCRLVGTIGFLKKWNLHLYRFILVECPPG